MAVVKCTIEETTLTNENGYDVEGIVVTCNKCGNTSESFGTSSRSIERCFAELREWCPLGEDNFYKEE